MYSYEFKTQEARVRKFIGFFVLCMASIQVSAAPAAKLEFRELCNTMNQSDGLFGVNRTSFSSQDNSQTCVIHADEFFTPAGRVDITVIEYLKENCFVDNGLSRDFSGVSRDVIVRGVGSSLEIRCNAITQAGRTKF